MSGHLPMQVTPAGVALTLLPAHQLSGRAGPGITATPADLQAGTSKVARSAAASPALTQAVPCRQKHWHIDCVVPVPDGSRPAAIQMSAELGLPYREGLVKNRYVGRTFIMPDQRCALPGGRAHASASFIGIYAASTCICIASSHPNERGAGVALQRRPGQEPLRGAHLHHAKPAVRTAWGTCTCVSPLAVRLHSQQQCK